MAYHLQYLDSPFTLLTRIGQEHFAVFSEFFDRHQIAYLPDTIVGQGVTAAIDIVILPDGQPRMDNFVEGVWVDFEVTAVEQQHIAQAENVHIVLVEGMIRELARLGEAGALAKPLVTANFLDFRHYTVGRLAETMRWLDVAFIGWPGSVTDVRLGEIQQVVRDQQKLLVMTLGSQGVWVMNGRVSATTPTQFFPTPPLPVPGTTIGCGDAFIAYFLAEFWQSREVARAVLNGKGGGERALQWQRPLPDSAYGRNRFSP